MTVNRSAILFLVIGLLTTSLRAQTSLNLYPLNGVVGLKFFSGNKISLEPRLDFQFDLGNGESNLFLSTEVFTTVNFLREEKFNMYSGVGLGANIYNQAQSNFSGTVPLGATYYIGDDHRIGIVGECGIKITALDLLKLKSYALIGMQVRLSRTKAASGNPSLPERK